MLGAVINRESRVLLHLCHLVLLLLLLLLHRDDWLSVLAIFPFARVRLRVLVMIVLLLVIFLSQQLILLGGGTLGIIQSTAYFLPLPCSIEALILSVDTVFPLLRVTGFFFIATPLSTNATIASCRSADRLARWSSRGWALPKHLQHETVHSFLLVVFLFRPLSVGFLPLLLLISCSGTLLACVVGLLTE